MRSFLTTFCAALLALAWGSPSSASITYGTVDVLGLLSARVEFTAVNGGIEVTVTNTESVTQINDQAISSLSFKVGDGLNAPTSFTELKGVSYDPRYLRFWTLASGTAFDDKSTATSPHAIDDWGFKATSSSVLLATAGSPRYMILPSSGAALLPSWIPGSLADKKSDPYIIGPATFFLADAGVTEYTNLTALNISSVWVGFGPGLDIWLRAKVTSVSPPPADPPTAAPEPSTLAIAGLGALGLVGYGLRRRRTK